MEIYKQSDDEKTADKVHQLFGKDDKMKAAVSTKYGPPEVLEIRSLKIPELLENEVLVQVQASGVTLYDCWSRSGIAPKGFKWLMRLVTGLRKPNQPIFGTEFAGTIAKVGSKVSGFVLGDEVFGFTGMNLGAHAEYITFPEDGAIANKPQNLSFEEAGSILQGAWTARYFLQNADIKPDQKILIIGASGGVGSFAVQLAKYFGCHVTGVCSGPKINFVNSLGADVVIDYKKDDYTRNASKYDIILDTMGVSPVSRCSKMLNDNGIYLFTTFGLPKISKIFWIKMRTGMRTFLGTLEESKEDLNVLRDMIENGHVKPIVDKTFILDEIVEAHEYVESGTKTGSVSIIIGGDNNE